MTHKGKHLINNIGAEIGQKPKQKHAWQHKQRYNSGACATYVCFGVQHLGEIPDTLSAVSLDFPHTCWKGYQKITRKHINSKCTVLRFLGLCLVG